MPPAFHVQTRVRSTRPLRRVESSRTLRSIECVAQKVQRLIVGLKRHGEGMTVFAAMRERESGRVVKATGRSVYDFGDQGERLQSARTKFFDQQQFGEIV